MFYLNTDKNDNILGISILTKPVDSDNENIYIVEYESVPDEVYDNLALYKYNGFVFTKKDQTELRNQYVKDYIRIKLKNLSSICNHMITEGIDYNGLHYSLSEDDQLNLSRLMMEAKTDKHAPIIYHADGESVRIYTDEEIIAIGLKANTWINYNTTYYNLMKQYVNTLTSSSLVESINYFQPLPSPYNELLNEAIDISEYPDFNTSIVFDSYDYSYIVPIINARPAIEMYLKQEEEKKEAERKKKDFNEASRIKMKRPY